MPTKFIGPWNGGLNLISNRDLSPFLSSNELGEATNVIYTPEGFLQPRPGCKMFLGNVNSPNDIYEHVTFGGTGYFRLIGNVDTGTKGIYALIEVFNGLNTWLYKVRDVDDVTLIATQTDGTRYTHLIVYSGFTSTQNLDTIEPAGTDYSYPADDGVLLFTSSPNKTYILPKDLDVIATPIVTWPAKFLVPASHKGMVIKDRLFLFDLYANKMYWSPPGFILDFRTINEAKPGPPPEPIYISAPFGKDTMGVEIIEPTTPDDIIRAVEFQNNNFYIFKRNATYMFTYQNNPTEDGYMRKISSEMGAFDSTNYKENIIVINNKGVFRVDGTSFIDLQQKMNFRFEIPIDHPKLGVYDVFITNFNDNILFGLRDTITDPDNYKTHYYNMNGLSGAWSKWDYTYTGSIAAPGSDFLITQKPFTTKVNMLFVDFWQQHLVYMNWKPSPDIFDYHLDSNYLNKTFYDDFYFPNVVIKTTASFGDSMLKYKKLYRYYIRLYLSDNPTPPPEYPLWTLSLNYNEYRFNPAKNPKFHLFPSEQDNFPSSGTDPDFLPPGGMPIGSAVYKRTYQVALPQQRTKEFLFELKRRYSVIPYGLALVNPDADRPVKAGYYFLLSGFWFDYENKSGIG